MIKDILHFGKWKTMHSIWDRMKMYKYTHPKMIKFAKIAIVVIGVFMLINHLVNKHHGR